jgi:hypothetical protein
LPRKGNKPSCFGNKAKSTIQDYCKESAANGAIIVDRKWGKEFFKKLGEELGGEQVKEKDPRIE